MIQEKYFKKHIIEITDFWNLSTVEVDAYDWNEDLMRYTNFDVTYVQNRDPRIAISYKLYLDASSNLMKKNPMPAVGDKIFIKDLEFEIVGFLDRYNISSGLMEYDIIARPLFL